MRPLLKRLVPHLYALSVAIVAAFAGLSTIQSPWTY